MTLRISALAIRNPIPVAILFIALTLMGLISYSQLPIKQYPNISFPVVVVTVTQSGAAPTEMENQITRPIEDALAGIAGVKHISSDITLGASTTSIEFELGSDMQKATDDVRTAVDRTRVLLPPGIDPPQCSARGCRFRADPDLRRQFEPAVAGRSVLVRRRHGGEGDPGRQGRRPGAAGWRDRP